MFLIPSNCGNKISTICTHVDADNKVEGMLQSFFLNKLSLKNYNLLGSCGEIWGKGDEVYEKLATHEGREGVINQTHSTPYGYKNNEIHFRSTFKVISYE